MQPLRALRRILQRAGFDVRRHDALGSPNLLRRRVLEFHRIELVIDGGANVGQYASKLREHGYAGEIVSFEPASAAFERLERTARGDPRWSCRQEGLAAQRGSGELRLAANSVSSSLLDATPALLACVPGARQAASETVRLVRLDDLAAELGIARRPTLLKLDLQGYELEALRGAQASLATLALVEVEQSLLPLYEGDPTFEQLLEFMRSRRFRVVSIEPNTLDPRSHHVIEVNAMFAREGA